jgi:anion-transporting  ArsA/GET3 family ATPase
MPRGKQKTIEDRISDIDSDIQEVEAKKAKLDEKIKALNGQKQELLDEIQHQKLQELQSIIEESGITVEEAIQRLQA